MLNLGKMWAGDTASYEAVLAALVAATPLMATGDTPPQSDLLSIQDGVGIVRVEGGLIPGNAGFLSYFGITGYGDVRDAMVEAANSPNVKSIMLDVNSGGGSVDGCVDCATLIAKIDAEVKPVMTYADGSIGSAAYWLGSSGRVILISPTTAAGSIGVVLKHSEMSKMRADIGITDTVIRSGKYKQLANNVEPLTESAKAQLQQMSDDIASVFVNHVADSRGVSAQAVQAKMGEGREFIGQRAVSAGLVDGISTYEGALRAAKALQPVDTNTPTRQNARSHGADMTTKVKKTLTAEQIAALAAGGVVDTSQAQDANGGGDDTAAEEAAAAAAAQAAADAAAQATADAAAAQAAADAAAAAAAANPQAESELVKFLRGEIASRDEKLTANAIKVAGLETKLVETEATMPKLLEIARATVNNMQVALGGAAGAAATMSPTQVLTAHAEVSATFAKKFRVGGVAAAGATAVDDKNDPAKPPEKANVFTLASRQAAAK